MNPLSALSPPWISRDGKLIIFARGIRSFGQSFVAVLLALYLDLLGFSLIEIGALLSVGSAGAALFAFVVALIAERVGRRRLLIGFSLLAAPAGLALFFTDHFVPLALFAFVGSMAANEGPRGPLQPLEQASLADAAPDERRTDTYALYGIVARGFTALGALAAGLPTIFQDAFGISEISAYKLMFLGFAFVQVAVALVYTQLSAAIEVDEADRRWGNLVRLPSRRRIFTLTGLFSVDHFAGSLLVQSLVALYFFTEYGIELEELAFIFFFSHVLAAISLWLAAKIANRIGLLNTMVFTHIPSSIFLFAVVFAPAGWMALLFWQFRAFLGQMDVPTRESYTMAIVRPNERVAMASLHNVGSSAVGTAGPSVATVMWNVLAASAPLIACGVLKIAYDVSLYFMFRNMKTPEETRRQEERLAASRQGKEVLGETRSEAD